MWDKDYYHDKALYGQGTALINQARRDAQKLKASTQGTHVGPAPRPRSYGGKTNIKDVLLIGAIVVVFSFLLPIIQWYVSDTRNYIATGAMIIPLFAVWIRRRLQMSIPEQNGATYRCKTGPLWLSQAAPWHACSSSS